MKEYKAIARVVAATSPSPISLVDFSKGVKVESGWCPTPAHAEDELTYFVEKQLGKGLYHFETIIEERIAA